MRSDFRSEPGGELICGGGDQPACRGDVLREDTYSRTNLFDIESLVDYDELLDAEEADSAGDYCDTGAVPLGVGDFYDPGVF